MRCLSKRLFSAVIALMMIAAAIPGYAFTAAAVLGDSQELSVEIDLEVGRYVGGTAEANWVPLVRGETLAVNDVVTVRICPESDFLCGITMYVTMFSKEYFEVVGSGTNAFTPNYSNVFYAQVASGYQGATSVPQEFWPLSMQNDEYNEYNAVKVNNTANSNSANGGYPGYMPGGWLFRFDLKVIKAVDAGSNARIWMDNRWVRKPDNIQAIAYFVKVERADLLCTTGSSTTHYFDVDLDGADITLSEILMAAENSTCLIDYEKMTISGLAAGLTSLTGYVNVASGYELSYIPSSNGFGTGTIVNITKDDITIDTYTIIIYGDVNGDGNIDSTDAGLMIDYENYLIPWDPLTDAVYFRAADLNGDGNIDSTDAGIVIDAENYVLTIDQTTGLVA
jgi:hypothetical protein